MSNEPAWVKPYLSHYRWKGNRSAAARRCGIRRSTPHEYAARHPAFAERVEEAREEALDRLEGLAFDIALGGAPNQREQARMIRWLLASLRRETYGKQVRVADTRSAGLSNEQDAAGQKRRS